MLQRNRVCLDRDRQSSGRACFPESPRKKRRAQTGSAGGADLRRVVFATIKCVASGRRDDHGSLTDACEESGQTRSSL